MEFFSSSNLFFLCFFSFVFAVNDSAIIAQINPSLCYMARLTQYIYSVSAETTVNPAVGVVSI